MTTNTMTTNTASHEELFMLVNVPMAEKHAADKRAAMMARRAEARARRYARERAAMLAVAAR